MYIKSEYIKNEVGILVCVCVKKKKFDYVRNMYLKQKKIAINNQS